MKISDFKMQMLYKNELGARIMVRLALPKTDEKTDLDRLYTELSKKYFAAAKAFISGCSDSAFYFFDVSYVIDGADKKYIKIKRLSTLKLGGKTLKATTLCDIFEKEGLSLKK